MGKGLFGISIIQPTYKNLLIACKGNEDIRVFQDKSEREVIDKLKKVKKKYEALNAKGEYEPYVGVLLYWINKK